MMKIYRTDEETGLDIRQRRANIIKTLLNSGTFVRNKNKLFTNTSRIQLIGTGQNSIVKSAELKRS
jgi:hypothetical protein